MWPVLAVVVLHLPALNGTLGSDEGGFAMVARWVDRAGPYLYGTTWVDRPPLLIAVFRAATLLGPHGTRVMATALAALIVVTLAATARAIAGRAAGTWAAWAACALAGSTMLSAEELNGELIAIAFVGVAMVAAVHAVRGGSRWRWAGPAWSRRTA